MQVRQALVVERNHLNRASQRLAKLADKKVLAPARLRALHACARVLARVSAWVRMRSRMRARARARARAKLRV